MGSTHISVIRVKVMKTYLRAAAVAEASFRCLSSTALHAIKLSLNRAEAVSLVAHPVLANPEHSFAAYEECEEANTCLVDRPR